MLSRILQRALVHCVTFVACAGATTQCAKAGEPPPLVFGAFETAGIDGRDWDAAFPGATTVDAVHRAVLLRFPGSARALRARIAEGAAIARAEVVLEYDGYEVNPDGYHTRPGLGEAKWKGDPPAWHVVAWPLRRAWEAHPRTGPTFNASANGATYWARYGAADPRRDRYDVRFGPAELSPARPEARLDVTAALTAAAFGADTESRLAAFESNGVLVRKLETYDQRYRDLNNAYEWAVPTGGHGLRFRNPRLVVEYRAGGAPAPVRAPVAAPPPEPAAGPTAVMPGAAEVRMLAGQAATRRPRDLTDWQTRRIDELYRVGGDRVSAWVKAVEAGDARRYGDLVRDLLRTPPRFWRGWGIQDDLLLWNLYRDLLPAYARDHMKSYWDAWLMPDFATKDLLHPQSKEAYEEWKKTRDWRGRASFFRNGYNYETSTQNFNHVAAMGALLGGSVIASEAAIADGRHGLEHFPLRLWSMKDGSTQEMLDHYYFSVTVSAQKMFADFGPAPLDRLMGRVMLDRSLEMLATAYHPALKRMVSASGRTRLSEVLVEQEGIYGVLHTLSRKGVLNYVDQPFGAKVRGLPVWGEQFPPGRVAVQAFTGRWGDDWWTRVIDDKPLPFEETAADTIRGGFNPPLWRRTYLGRHYGLASQDIKGGTVDLIAQWNRRDQPAERMEDLGTLTLRYAVNEPDMATTRGGAMPAAGSLLTFQHRNRAIVCTRPLGQRGQIEALAGKGGLKSLASVIALWSFREPLGWQVLVDGRPPGAYPAAVKAGQVITIGDGVSYVGIVPVPAADLGRRDEVVIGPGGGGRNEGDNTLLAPVLTIASYNLQSDRAAADTVDWPRITGATYGGFVIEVGDAAEHGDFARFTRMRANQLATQWDAAARVLHVKYRSGSDTLEMGCGTSFQQGDVHYPVPPGQQAKAIVYRRINGAFPYLPAGIDRDTSISQQGTSGRLEKHGAVLVTDKGRTAYLQAEPGSGTYVGYNPLPDPTAWSLAVPGLTVAANGRVGLLKTTVQPRENRIAFEYALKPGQAAEANATHLVVTGAKREPVVERNRSPLKGPFATATVDGARAYLIPLQ